MTGSESLSVKEYFGSDKAKAYDEQIRQSIPGYEGIHGMVYAFLLNELPENAHVLVAGAGTGMELLYMGQRRPGWRFTAFDISSEMLTICEECLAGAGMRDRVTLVHGSTKDIPETMHYDAATSLLVSHFITDSTARATYYSGIAKRCKPGAPFLIADLVGDKTDPAFELFGKAWWTFNINNGRDPVELEEGFKKSAQVVSYLPEDAYCSMLTDAGFSVVKQFFRGLLFSGWFCRAVL